MIGQAHEPLGSDDYRDLAHQLIQELYRLFNRAKAKSLTFPLDVHVTDCDDKTVVHITLDRDTSDSPKFGEGSLSLSPETKLYSRPPLTIVVRDTAGNYFEYLYSPL